MKRYMLSSIVALGMVGGALGCLGPGNVHKSLSQTGASGAGESQPPIQAGNPGEASGGQMFSIGSASAALNLNASLQLMMNIKAASNFNGQVALSVDRASVGAIDKGQDISISVSPSSVNLAAGSSAVLTVMISSKSTAPDLSAVPFKIVATEMNPVGAAASSSVSVPLTVNPMIVIKFLGHPVAGQATEKFTGETDSTDIAKSTLSLRGHKNGVTVRFLNMDTAGVHRVHGNNAIVHEGAGGFAGEKVKNQYDVPVMAQVATTGQFYCHDDSDTADTVTMNFNAMPAE